MVVRTKMAGVHSPSEGNFPCVLFNSNYFLHVIVTDPISVNAVSSPSLCLCCWLKLSISINLQLVWKMWMKSTLSAQSSSLTWQACSVKTFGWRLCFRNVISKVQVSRHERLRRLADSQGTVSQWNFTPNGCEYKFDRFRFHSWKILNPLFYHEKETHQNHISLSLTHQILN